MSWSGLAIVNVKWFRAVILNKVGNGVWMGWKKKYEAAHGRGGREPAHGRGGRELDAAHGRGGQVANQKVDQEMLLACRRFTVKKE